MPSKKEKTSEIINKSDSLGDVISWIPIVENTSINHKDSLKFQNDIIFDFNNKSKVEIITIKNNTDKNSVKRDILNL